MDVLRKFSMCALMFSQFIMSYQKLCLRASKYYAKNIYVHPIIAICFPTHRFLFDDHNSQQLIFQTLHCDSEVNDRGSGVNLRGVTGVTQFSRDVHLETLHDVTFFVSDLDFQLTA